MRPRRMMRRISRRTTRRMLRRRAMVGGMVVASTTKGEVTKMSPEDAKKVETSAGKPIEEMTTDELQQHVEKTGVQEKEVKDEDIRALESES